MRLDIFTVLRDRVIGPRPIASEERDRPDGNGKKNRVSSKMTREIPSVEKKIEWKDRPTKTKQHH